jgi:Transmembrane domain of unknown function (DUF3566)
MLGVGVNSPNESGSPKKGDNPNGDGSAERSGAHRATSGPSGRTSDAGDSPPWQRGATRAANPRRSGSEASTESRPTTPPSGIDARLDRFVSGTSGAGTTARGIDETQELDAAPARADGPPAEAYASELPDLSGPIPRPPQRTTATERAADTSTTSTTSRTATTESREAREARAAREARESRSETRESRVQVSRRTRGPVRASMQIRRIDPWSTLKVSLLLSVALFFVWMIAVAFLYLVLGGMGVWAKLNSNVGDLLNNTSGSAGELVSSGTIFGGAVLIGLVNIVLMTAMATIAAFVYNLATDLIGGIEVTLADLD